MAATVGTVTCLTTVPFQIQKTSISTLVADQLVSITHLGPSDATVSPASTIQPFNVTCTVTTRATSGDPVFFSWEGTSITAGTVSVRFSTSLGGDLTGAVVTVLVWFKDVAAGGLDDFV